MKKLPDLLCEDCGKPAGRSSGGIRRKVCVNCSMERAHNAAREMANKTGAAYDRWRNSAGPNGRPRIADRQE